MKKELEARLRFIGWVTSSSPNFTTIEVLPAYREGLRGLESFSHVVLLYWLHLRDTLEDRRRLLVHPRANPANPLTGVFATRSPVRPNPIGLTVTELRSVEQGILRVAPIDAFVGTPIIDIKPYLPHRDSIPSARTASWAAR